MALYTFNSVPGTAIVCLLAEEYQPQLLQVTATVDELVEMLQENHRTEPQYIPGTDGLTITYDWSSDLDFGNHTGGGYFIMIDSDENDDIWQNNEQKLYIYIEWDDDWAIENGIAEQRGDEKYCLTLGLQLLFRWIQDTLA